MKKKAVRAVCKVCGKKFHSLTTNKDGLIICPKCDKKFKIPTNW